MNFSQPPWETASLVAPVERRNLAKKKSQTETAISICTDDDTFKGSPLTMKEKCLLEPHCGKCGTTTKLGQGIYSIRYIYIGMVMVTEDVDTDLGITNGACGRFGGMILHLGAAYFTEDTSGIVAFKALSETRQWLAIERDVFVLVICPHCTSDGT